MERIFCVLIGYVFGLFQSAFFLGKAHRIDIRQHGSGNAGTTNTLRVLGTKAGLWVFAGDCIKCILAVLLVRALFKPTHPEYEYIYSVYAAFGVVLGHDYPFYMNFKGGKGIASTAGLIISFFNPWFILIGALTFFGPFIITHYVSLGSLLLYAGLLGELIFWGQTGRFTDMTQGNLVEMYIVVFILLVMAYVRHRENIVRLIKGQERKTYLIKRKQKQ